MPRIRLTAAERRERARLRSLRWRRAHGIGPRKPAQRPWLALGIGRSTYYRRRAKARERAETAQRHELLDRASAFARQLQAELAAAARCQAVTAAMIDELAQESIGRRGSALQ